jgi:diguanylate cyclase (GGDEF)-like protein
MLGDKVWEGGYFMSFITDTTLLEQMHISGREIALRKRLFGFTEKDVANLLACREWITVHLDEITEDFYRQQVAEPEISLVIGDRDTLDRLKSSMRHYILDLFQGYYDAEYVNKRLRVGKVHKRIGVTPKLYMSAVRLLMSILDQSLDNMLSSGNCAQCRDTHNSLHKLILFDTQLVFDTYINSMTSEIFAAKREVEEYAESLESRIAERTKELQELSLRDPLTKLLNQRAFYDNLRRELSLAERVKRSVCLAYFDLNGFKAVNDNLGHKIGDAVLETTAVAMSEALRDTDLACRYGGDEFCVIMPNAAISEAENVCKRLTEHFDTKITHGVSMSIGIIQSCPENHLEMNEMVKLADAKMYQAKERSRANPGHHIVC